MVVNQMQPLHGVSIASACADQNTRHFFVLVEGFNFFVKEKRRKYENFGGKKGKEEEGEGRGECREGLAPSSWPRIGSPRETGRSLSRQAAGGCVVAK